MKHYRIAGLHVAMDSYGRTADQAVPYEVNLNGEPDIVISSYAESLHRQYPQLSIDDCEYLQSKNYPEFRLCANTAFNYPWNEGIEEKEVMECYG